MKPPARPLFSGSAARLLLVLLGVVLAAIFSMTLHHPVPPLDHPPVAQAPPAATNLMSSPAAKPAAVADNPGFQLHPFPVANESSSFQWTAADGKDTNVIRRLAHNDLEYQRMVEENKRIQRRQLVYLKETAAAVMERSRASGEAVKQLTLPGLDGREVQFDIHHADLEPSQLVGNFTGQIPNRPNSMVTLAFKFGRESFTIISPDDKIFLQAWPREPGEVIVTSFDPDVYQSMPEGEPIKTTNTFKIAQ